MSAGAGAGDGAGVAAGARVFQHWLALRAEGIERKGGAPVRPRSGVDAVAYAGDAGGDDRLSRPVAPRTRPSRPPSRLLQ